MNDRPDLRQVDMPPAVERVLEADRAFFARHPARRHRVRLMGGVEERLGADNGQRLPDLPEGWRWFVAVRLDEPGTWSLLTFAGPDGGETDAPEEMAAHLYGFTDAFGPTGLLLLHATRCELEGRA